MIALLLGVRGGVAPLVIDTEQYSEARLGRFLFNSTLSVWVACLVLLTITGVSSAQTLPEGVYHHHTRHYHVITDVDRRQLRAIMARMDAVAAAYLEAIPGFPIKGGKSAPLYLFTHARDYHRFLESLGIDSRGSGGMFFASQVEGGLSTWIENRSEERIFHVLQHEGFHHFANLRIGGEFPVWANEGFAEYFGQGQFVRGKLRLGTAPASRIERLREAVEQEAFFPLQEMLMMSSRDWNSRVRTSDVRARMQYDQAWALVHFLLHAERGEYRRALLIYVQETSSGTDLQTAASRAFGTTNFDAFQRKWIEYVESLEPDPVSTSIERLEFLGAGLMELHAQGTVVDSMEELRDALRRIEFEYEVRDGHTVRVLSSKDDALFEPPNSGHSRRKTTYEFKGGETHDAPSIEGLPTIEVSGLPVRVLLEWKTNPDGEAIPEVTIR